MEKLYYLIDAYDRENVKDFSLERTENKSYALALAKRKAKLSNVTDVIVVTCMENNGKRQISDTVYSWHNGIEYCYWL